MIEIFNLFNDPSYSSPPAVFVRNRLRERKIGFYCDFLKFKNSRICYDCIVTIVPSIGRYTATHHMSLSKKTRESYLDRYFIAMGYAKKSSDIFAKLDDSDLRKFKEKSILKEYAKSAHLDEIDLNLL